MASFTSLTQESGSIPQATGPTADAIIELRRYRLYPGTRETLIDLFDREFIESQETQGMSVIGQFRDLDDPNSFVWLRGFRDMPSRAAALNAFYTGPVWAAHRDQANGTMINSDNVLLLRPTSPGAGFAPPLVPRPAPGASDMPRGLVVATICYLAPRTEDEFARFFEAVVRPHLEQALATVLATLVTERSPNTFSRLPVREGETVFVWFSTFPSVAAYETHLAELARSVTWTREAVPEMEQRTWRQNEVSRLAPTTRSLLP
ncbi:NIPSNAP family protein [Microvirga sp. VF16]|uniref:NIPSNAP family protein n=1 Tax=Microvirga sp. VF16 TaxID=2807101 RepID=UPI00193DDAFB|nr:NIPSNAP family protein [Microvirga sp. VF16]QRM29472.1 NIPSNAP family protein [Microvirga sp. VF16]